MHDRIPFNQPAIVGRELDYIRQAVTDRQLAGDGQFTRRAQRVMEQRYGVGKVLLTHSCTAGLEMAADLLELGAGDEVIVPSFTFVSTANAFVRRGALPCFVDIRPDTQNLDERLIEAAITPRTKSIWVVHYAGIACEMDTILDIARRHGLSVVEDAAQGVDATYNGRPLGSIGALGSFSFHETKNLVAGHGGALLINAPEHVERAEIIRQRGTNRSKFLRGEVDKYTWVDSGSHYGAGELIAAFLCGQLDQIDEIQRRRCRIFDRYHAAFADAEEAGLVRRPTVPDGCVPSYHMYYLVLPTTEQRDEFIAVLSAAGAHSVFHYVPLHSSPMGRKLVGEIELPNTDRAADCLVRLPFFFDLGGDAQGRVIDAALGYLDRLSG